LRSTSTPTHSQLPEDYRLARNRRFAMALAAAFALAIVLGLGLGSRAGAAAPGTAAPAAPAATPGPGAAPSVAGARGRASSASQGKATSQKPRAAAKKVAAKKSSRGLVAASAKKTAAALKSAKRKPATAGSATPAAAPAAAGAGAAKVGSPAAAAAQPAPGGASGAAGAMAPGREAGAGTASPEATGGTGGTGATGMSGATGAGTAAGASAATTGALAAPAKGTLGPEPSAPFLEAFPKFRDYLFQEPTSGLLLGFGISPVGFLQDRSVFSLQFFQVHWMSSWLDYEALNASYVFTRAQSPELQSTSMVFRTSLRLRIGRYLSIGPLVGYEYISFPGLQDILYKAPYATKLEPFSSQGLIYGGVLSQVFRWRDGYVIQLNELAYQETYSSQSTPENWAYYFGASDAQNNRTLIGASWVSMIEAVFLF
jgi:hypothetical protein